MLLNAGPQLATQEMGSSWLHCVRPADLNRGTGQVPGFAKSHVLEKQIWSRGQGRGGVFDGAVTPLIQPRRVEFGFSSSRESR